MRASRRTVLVVEDDPMNRELFEAVLVAAGFIVITARDAHTGIEAAKRRHPDVVLMDIQLPEMDGLEATRILRGDTETSAIPIIAVTAHAKKEDEDHCLMAGCVRHLSKPVDTRALPGILTQVIDEAGVEQPRAEEPDSITETLPSRLTTTAKSS